MDWSILEDPSDGHSIGRRRLSRQNYLKRGMDITIMFQLTFKFQRSKKNPVTRNAVSRHVHKMNCYVIHCLLIM